MSATVQRRSTLLLALIGLLMLSVAYCLPYHWLHMARGALHVVIHIAVFAAFGYVFGRLMPYRVGVLVAFALLAALLEVLQWWFGGFSQIEWRDILTNEFGLLLAALLLWMSADHSAAPPR